MKHAFKKIMAFVIVLAMVIGIVPAAFAANVGPFTDVDDSTWYAPYVEYAYENGLMSGMTATTFEPNSTLTRAQAVVVIHRLANEPAVSELATFTDLTQDWYKIAIAWAEDVGIVNGIGNGKFDPQSPVTREQLVTMLWRAVDTPVAEEDHLAAYPDADKVAEYAVDAMNWAISLGVINGIPHGEENYLEPQGHATRAQYAKIIAALCGFVPPVEEVVILFTNDVHTYIDKPLSYDSIAAMKTETAATAEGVLLVDAGDHVQGTAYGSMDDGETIIELMNAAGYDLATLGNHEFDYGMERALELVDKANFPYVSANFYHEKDGVRGDTVLNAYEVFEVGGKTIAFVGITTPETFTKSTPKYFQDENGNYIYGIGGGTDGAQLYADVQKAIDAARAEGVDYVIALGHCGDDPASMPWTSEEVIANTTGLDAFIDGHSHSTVEQKEVADKAGSPVVLTQTGEYFNAIGRMSITDNGISVRLVTSYNGYDPEVRELKEAWISEVDTLLGEKIAVNEVDFRIYDVDGSRLIRSQETNLGDYAADALYYLFSVTEGLDVDAAIMNGGGIRADMPAGDISYKTTKTVHTFGNVACLITVTGQQILDALEWGAQSVGVGENGGFLQVSGITYEIHSYIEPTVQADDKNVWTGGPTGEYRVKNVTIGGEPLELDKSYNLAGYNYTLRDLGDGFAMFNGAVNVKDYVMEDYLVLANYAKSFPNATIKADNSVLGADYSSIYGEGRITIVTEGPENEPIHSEAAVPSTHRDGANIPAFITLPGDYTETGSYPLVVMIHGHGGNHNEWGGYDAISNGLAAEGIAVVTLDFPGCGNSTESFRLNTMTNMKNDVLDVLNYMTTNYAVDTDKVGAFGYSMGGRIILEMITEELYDFATIELVAPGEDTEDLKDLFGGAEAWETMKAAANENGYVEFTTIYGQSQELSKEWFADLEKYADGLVELAAENYTGESLVIWGTQDEAVRPFVSENVADVLDSIVLNTYDAAGHSYSFYGADEYTVPIVNNGSVNYLVEELLCSEHRIHGFVSGISSYGNLELSIPADALTEAGYAYGEMLVVTVNGTEFTVPYHGSYNDVAEGEAVLRGYNGALSLAIRMGDFATVNGIAANTDGDWYYADPAATPLFVIIEDVDTANCDHTYTEERVEPTCVTGGSVTYTCTKCGDSYTELLDSTGEHTDEDKNGFCDHCGAVVSSGEIDLEGKSFVKVTQAPADWSGVYLIVSEGNSVALNGALGGLDSGRNVIDVTITDGKIEATEETAASIFVISAVSGGYSIQSASELYIGGDASANKLVTSSTEAFVNTIALGSDGVDIQNNGKYLRFNSINNDTNYRFRYYKAGSQQPVQLYKLTDGTPDTPAPEPTANEYVLTNELKDGDKVVIVNAASSKALGSAVINTYYKAGVDVAPTDSKIVNPDASIVWTVVADGEGFNLVNAEGNKLSIDGTFNSIPYDKGNDGWSAAAAATENCVYVINENGKYLQWSSHGNFSAYTYSEANEATFAMNIYTLSASETPDPDPAERYVVIYNPAKGKVMTTEAKPYTNSSGTTKDQLASADAAPAGDRLTTEATNAALFKMVTTDGITTFQTKDGKYLYADGTHVRLVDTAGENTQFVLEAVEGGYYIKCANATYNGKAQYLEFYSNVFTVYGMGSDPSIYTFAFYELAEEETADEIVIYYTNDVHTYIDKTLSYDSIAALKEQTAADGTPVFLFDAGDHVQGTAYGSMDKGETIIDLMNAAGYDLATLGNHEFDYGMERALELVGKANFPYVSANFYHEKNGVVGDTVLDSYVILEANGTKIAVIGITTPETFTKSTPAYFQDENGNYIYGIAGGTDGAALYAAVQKAIDAAKAEGVDYVIALGHCGDDPASKPWTSEEVIANTTGLDAFIDGHSHSTVVGKEVADKNGNAVLLTQTGEYFNAIGKMTITADGIATELVSAVEGSDTDVKAIQDAWISEINTKLGEVIGHTDLTLDNYDADGNRMVRKYETNSGDFAADALYYLFDNMDMDVDLAIMNGGGIRNAAVTGDISYLTCKSIHTFGNVACLITVTGQQVLDALEWGAKQTPVAEVGGFLHVSGLTYKVNGDIESTVQQDEKAVWTGGPTGEYRVHDVKIYNKETGAWEDLDLNATYNMAGYNYTLRDLGDGFAMFDGAVNVLDYVMEDYMVLANYVQGFENNEVGATNSPLLAKYEGFKLDYSDVNGSGRIEVSYTAPEAWDGVITIGGLTPNVWTTKYGNIYTDCSAAHFFNELGLDYADLVTVKFLDQELVLPVVPTYSYVDAGTPALLVGMNENGSPTGYAYLAINNGNFAETYGIAYKGTDEAGNWYWTAFDGVEFPIIVTFELYEKEGYMDQYLLHELTRTNNRADYAHLTDEQFANFRAVATTGMGAGVLYRSSSPINPEIGRNTYADAAARAAGIKTFVNLADSESEAAAYPGFADSYYSTQNVIYLSLGVDYGAAEFGSGLARGLRYIIANDGPYMVHCTEGKDRAGFTSALLECFMGASYEEVVADYMVTYYNYYGIEPGTEKYTAIAQSNIIKTLEKLFGVEDLAAADLQAEATEHLASIGLTEDEIAALAEKLGADVEQSGPKYVLSATAPEAGDNFVVCALVDGVYYALTTVDVNNAKSAGTAVTVVDGVLMTDAANVFWNASNATYGGNTGIGMRNAADTAKCLHLNSSSIRVAQNYNNGVFAFEESGDGYIIHGLCNDRYLTFSGTNFGVSTSAASAATVYFFIEG